MELSSLPRFIGMSSATDYAPSDSFKQSNVTIRPLGILWLRSLYIFLQVLMNEHLDGEAFASWPLS